MNDSKLKRLFASARRESPPEPSREFASDVLRAIRRDSAASPTQPFDLVEQLNYLFTHLVWAAAAVILLCLAADLGLTAAGWPGMGEGTAQISSSFLFIPEDL
jgi:hypothetical protein